MKSIIVDVRDEHRKQIAHLKNFLQEPDRDRIAESIHYTYEKIASAKTPYVVVSEIDGFMYSLLNESERDYTRSFSSIEEAEAAIKEFEKNFHYDCAIVLKNRDFTEGSGPMVFHKIFRTAGDAERYVAEQDGIYGSKQHRVMNYGININGGGYAYPSWNGYQIQLKRCE